MFIIVEGKKKDISTNLNIATSYMDLKIKKQMFDKIFYNLKQINK